MMNSKSLLCLLLITGMACASAAQDSPTTVDETESDPSEIGEEPEVDPLQLLTEPGEHHDHLDRLVGDWDLTIKVWTSPDGEPIESAGSAETRWILDRRFLWTIYRAELFGQPFEAWSIEGYDNQAKQYVSTWRDTQGTYTLVYRGKCRNEEPTEGEAAVDSAPTGEYRVMTTKITDPTSEEKLDIRTELRIQEDGSFIQESFIVLSPEESIKNLELIGHRRDE